MLYRSTDRLCRGGAAVENLAHSASFHSVEYSAPSNSGTKHLDAVQVASGNDRFPVPSTQKPIGRFVPSADVLLASPVHLNDRPVSGSAICRRNGEDLAIAAAANNIQFPLVPGALEGAVLTC
jgi:hypothetical protein